MTKALLKNTLFNKSISACLIIFIVIQLLGGILFVFPVKQAQAALIDDFNRADNADVGNDWELVTGGTDIWDISGNKLRAQPSGVFHDKALFRPAFVLPANQLKICRALLISIQLISPIMHKYG